MEETGGTLEDYVRLNTLIIVNLDNDTIIKRIL